MKTIPLTQGYEAIVDDDDYNELSRFKWQVAKRKNTNYAIRTTKRNGKQYAVLMHAVVNKTPCGMVTDHIDGNGLNNVRSNLRSCTKGQNTQRRVLGPTKGVTYVAACSVHPWWARIWVNDTAIDLGRFSDKQDALDAYDRAAVYYFGDLAYTHGGAA